MEPHGFICFNPNDGWYSLSFTLTPPVLFLVQMSHSARGSVGLFWLNAAEGWVDIKKNGQVRELNILYHLILDCELNATPLILALTL